MTKRLGSHFSVTWTKSRDGGLITVDYSVLVCFTLMFMPNITYLPLKYDWFHSLRISCPQAWESQSNSFTNLWDTSSLSSLRQANFIGENLLKVIIHKSCRFATDSCSTSCICHSVDLYKLEYGHAAEDNLNISLKDITVTGRDGRVSQLDQVYIRGSMIRFFIVPDMLQNAPM